MTLTHFLSVGFVVLTPDQSEELEIPTMNISRKDPRPLIQLDVFHELHCLDSLRKSTYGTSPWSLDGSQERAHLGTSAILTISIAVATVS